MGARVSRIRVSEDRGVFMISVAAELAEMHPQTLRIYEARGLIEPKRSPVNPPRQPENRSEDDECPKESVRAARPGDFAGATGYARRLGECGHRALC